MFKIDEPGPTVSDLMQTQLRPLSSHHGVSVKTAYVHCYFIITVILWGDMGALTTSIAIEKLLSTLPTTLITHSLK
jgi:hypothetical protein